MIYHSARFGEIKLKIPKHPDVEEGRKLFAHYLWNAGVICADAVEEASSEDMGDDGRWQEPEGEGRREVGVGVGGEQKESKWDRRYWDMRGKRILELGAGT